MAEEARAPAEAAVDIAVGFENDKESPDAELRSDIFPASVVNAGCFPSEIRTASPRGIRGLPLLRFGGRFVYISLCGEELMGGSGARSDWWSTLKMYGL